MGRENGEYFDDTLPMAEVGELGTSIEGPTAETALVIKLVSKQALTLSHFADMFYNLQFNLSESDILENGYEKIKLMSLRQNLGFLFII